MRHIKIELVENSGAQKRKRDQILDKIGQKYPKAMDKLMNYKDFYHWNDCSASEFKLLRNISQILEQES